MSEGPYSRVYWSVLDDKKFDPIRADMRLFGSWALMLVIADMAYPAPAFIPPTVPRAALKALVDVKLIELLPAHMYRIVGLKKERERRSEAGRTGATARWSSNATAMRPQSGTGIATALRPLHENALLDETRRVRDEKRLDEAETSAREDFGTSDQETAVFAFLAQHGAAIRPDAPLGRRLLGLMGRRGPDVVLKEAESMTKVESVMSDRQWVLGLENGLEAIPSGRKTVDEAVAEEGTERRNARSEQIQRRMAERRLEWFRNTGKWDEAWGPQPESVA